MKLLGISAYYHDSAAVITENGRIVAAAQEERFTRKKHDESFPVHAVQFCLESAGLRICDLDAVVFYDKPFLKFERILSTAVDFAPKGLIFFLRSIPVWLKEKLFLKRSIREHLKLVMDRIGEDETDVREIKLLFSNHHLSHAASAFYCSPFESAAVLTIDGVGEYATASIGLGKGKALKLVREMHFPHSIGLLYSAFTYFLGFRINNGEYKVMGLAPYAEPTSALVVDFRQRILDHLIDIFDDGSIRLHLEYFTFQHALRMIPEKKWEKVLGIRRRQPDSPVNPEHAALAQALQQVTEEVVLKMAKHAREITGEEYLCLAGGVALNCVANGKLFEKGWFKDIYVQPAAGDAGGALGAALGAYHLHYKAERKIVPDYMEGGNLGPVYTGREIHRSLERRQSVITYQGLPEQELLHRTAEAILSGKVVGWFQGRMEFGPRALGQRSILANAADAEMQHVVNLKIKKRESFRPFAPIMLEEEAAKYFEHGHSSEYMLFVHKVKPEYRHALPAGYRDMDLSQMLNINRSVFPSVTHTDFSARLQTVPTNSPKRIRKLLEVVKDKTGCGLIINTSFNVKGEPIVCTPEDALNCFLNTEMDILAIGDYWVEKK
jgi:carbamoyltransferase